MKSVLIIIPAHNEDAIILDVINQIKQAIKEDKNFHYDILVVDDASTDNTATLVKSSGVNYIKLCVNLGIGGAMQVGYSYAASKRYDAVIQVDGDGQHNPNEITKLIQTLFEKNYSMVIGSRFIDQREYVPSIPRQVGMLFSRIMLLLVTGKKIYDTTSGFRAIQRDLFLFYAENYSLEFAGIVPIAMALKKGFSITEIKAKFHYRKTGSSSINIKKSIYYPFQTCLALLSVVIQKV